MRSRWSPFIVTTSLVTIMWGCRSVGSPDYYDTAELDQPFVLRVGERARVERAGLDIRFAEVGGDSRCPSNALILCVWEGDAAVVVEITPPSGGVLTDTLHTTLDPKAVEVGSFSIQLQRLDPYPEDVTPIPEGEYLASFVLESSS